MSGEFIPGRNNYKETAVIEALPGPDGPRGEEDLFESLAGATIIRVGMPSDIPLEGGGLVVDYRLAGETGSHRAIFAFNENGMWLVWREG
jgi:hypothetical protein